MGGNVSFATVRADAFDDEVGRVGQEAFGQFNVRQRLVVDAIGSLALLTEEMGMEVFIVLMAMAVAQLIFHALAPPFNDMNQMMLAEEGQGAEDARLVDGYNPTFQFHQ